MTNSIHDMGGMHGFGPVEPEPDEPPFHAALGGPRPGDAARDGLYRAVDDRRRPRLARSPAAARLSRLVLLPALVSRPRKPAAAARPRRRRRDRRRPLAAPRRRAAAHPDPGRCREDPDPRRLRPPDQHAGALQAGRPGAHQKHQPRDPYPPAALCPRQDRHGRGGPRLPRLSRYRRARRRRRPAMALHGGLSGARIVGRGRPTPRSRSRSRRSSPISTRHERRPSHRPARRAIPGLRAAPTARCSARRGRRRPSPWRWRCTSAASSPGPNGPRPSPTRSSAPRRRGDPDTGDTYYRHWLAALERLVAEKGAADPAALARYRAAWQRAARRTPHGAPIALQPEDFAPEHPGG